MFLHEKYRENSPVHKIPFSESVSVLCLVLKEHSLWTLQGYAHFMFFSPPHPHVPGPPPVSFDHDTNKRPSCCKWSDILLSNWLFKAKKYINKIMIINGHNTRYEHLFDMEMFIHMHSSILIIHTMFFPTCLLYTLCILSFQTSFEMARRNNF